MKNWKLSDKIIMIGKKLKSMVIPSLPTDNLYKFGFVGSIFLFGLILIGYLDYRKSLENSYNDIIIEDVKLNLEYGILEDEFHKTDRLIGGTGLTGDTASAQKLKDAYTLKYNAFVRADTLIRIQSRNLNKKITSLNCYTPLIIFVQLLLMGISCKFACLWYKKLQQFQDKLIKLECNKKENENKLP